MTVDAGAVRAKPQAGEPITIEELKRMPDDGHKYERVERLLQVTPAGHEQEDIGAVLIELLGSFARKRGLGRLYGSNAGYLLPNGDLRCPDVSYVRQERLPGGRSPKGFAEYPPDLAVEVLSPNQTHKDIGYKIGELIDWGTPLVWVVDPAARTVAVYRSLGDTRTLGLDDALSGEDVIPGFSVQVRENFE